MQPPRAIPLLLTLIALALPAGAQIKTNVGADAAAGAAGQVGSSLYTGGVAPIGLPGNGTVAPLSLTGAMTPTLAAPAASVNQGLAPSALTTKPLPMAANPDKLTPQPAAEASPPQSQPEAGPSGAPAALPYFVQALSRLGVTGSLTAQLEAFLAARPADEQNSGRAQELANIAASAVAGEELPAEKKILLILSAALRGADTLDNLDQNDAARALLLDFSSRYGFTAAQVKAMVLAADVSSDSSQIKTKEAAFTQAAGEAFPSEPGWAAAWGKKLAAAEQSHKAWTAASAPVAARAPPVNLDLAVVKKFIRGIMGGSRAPTTREADALLGDWLDEQGIPRQSRRARDVRSALLPAQAASDAAIAAKLHPALRGRSALLIRLAADNETTVEKIQEALTRRRLLDLAKTLPDHMLEGQIAIALEADELSAAVANYPDTEAGALMRDIARNMTTKSGKSVEEIARDGVFVYAHFQGLRPVRATAGRDPDVKSAPMIFYVTRTDGKWQFDGYRQNRQTGFTDAELISSMKAWLRKGGIPPKDLR